MALVNLGTVPEQQTVSEVWTQSVVTDEGLPRSIFGRRNTFDELIYDAELGFTDNWKAFSSITPSMDGYTLVLGRRAYSAAGVTVFAAYGAGGGGTGDASSIQGIDVSEDAPDDGQILVYDDGTSTIVWEDPPVDDHDAVSIHGTSVPALSDGVLTSASGVLAWTAATGTGDVVGPASAVADHIATYNGTTGKIIKDSGVALADLTAALAKKVYRGGYNVNMAYTNGDWYDLSLAPSGGSWRDDEQVGITHSSGTFTVAAAGYYHVDAAYLAFYSSTNPLMGIRVTRTHSAVTTIAMSKADYAGTGSATSNNVEVHGVVYCDAGDTLNVQYCFYDAPGSAPGFGLNAPGAGQMRGQATDLAMIHIHRIPYLL